MERLRRGWTLGEVSARTHISITVLKLLEEKRFENIGPEPTIKSLLQTYSSSMGEERPSHESSSARVTPNGESEGRKLRTRPYLRPILAAVLIAAIIGVSGVLYHNYRTRLNLSSKPTPKIMTENPANEPKIEQSNAEKSNTEENRALPDEERAVIAPEAPVNTEQAGPPSQEIGRGLYASPHAPTQAGGPKRSEGPPGPGLIPESIHEAHEPEMGLNPDAARNPTIDDNFSTNAPQQVETRANKNNLHVKPGSGPNGGESPPSQNSQEIAREVGNTVPQAFDKSRISPSIKVDRGPEGKIMPSRHLEQSASH